MIVPIISISSHDGPYGLKKDYPAAKPHKGSDWIKKGWMGESANEIIASAKKHKWKELTLWLPWGYTIENGIFAWKSYDTIANKDKAKIGNALEFAQWAQKLFNTTGCKLILYLPPLVPVDVLRQGYAVADKYIKPAFEMKKLGLPVTVIFDTLGAVGHQNKPNPHAQWSTAAYLDYLTNLGIETGCEPCGELGTIYSQICTCSYVTSDYLLGHEEEVAKAKDPWIDLSWVEDNAPNKKTYIQISRPEHDKHISRWEAAGYYILKQGYTYDIRTATPIVPIN